MRISFSSALRNIRRNRLVNLLSLGIISFTLMIFGIFEYVSFSLDNFTQRFSQNVEAIFYLQENATDSQIDGLIRKMKDSLMVEKVAFKSTRQARESFSREFPELEFILAEFDKSPFPPSIEVTFKKQYNFDTKALSFIEETARLAPVESKQVNLDWAHKMVNIKQFISLVGAFLSIILIFVSIFIIYNVIKLNIIYRRDEIYILRLVGATRWYIRFPFVIEGALLGFFSSILAGCLLFGAVRFFPFYAGTVYNLLNDIVKTDIFPYFILGHLLILGTAIGLFSSLFALKKFLRH